MRIEVTKLTDIDLMREACDATRKAGMDSFKPSTMTLKRIYQCEHSPARTQLFKIHLYDIPSYVSTHLVRHSVAGQYHAVESNRADRGGSDTVTRLTPVHHLMILNAQHLIDMSRVRICLNADRRTVAVMAKLRTAIEKIDADLAEFMVPNCVARGYCPELRECKAGVVKVLSAYKDNWMVVERAKVSQKLRTQK
jgi:hypothetical protein